MLWAFALDDRDPAGPMCAEMGNASSHSISGPNRYAGLDMVSHAVLVFLSVRGPLQERTKAVDLVSIDSGVYHRTHYASNSFIFHGPLHVPAKCCGNGRAGRGIRRRLIAARADGT